MSGLFPGHGKSFRPLSSMKLHVETCCLSLKFKIPNGRKTRRLLNDENKSVETRQRRNKINLTYKAKLIPVAIKIGSNSLKRLNNGLINEKNYYKIYDQNKATIISSYGEHCLRLDDYLTLVPNKWLSNFVIDYICQLKFKNSSYIPCTMFTVNFDSERLEATSPILNYKLQENRYLICIYLKNSNHYCVFIIDNFKKQYTYYDPMSNDLEYISK